MITAAFLSASVRNLRRSPVRSSLTMLGIVVGVGAVVATDCIGAGAKTRIQQVLAKPESRTIFLGASLSPNDQPGRSKAQSASQGLTAEDYEEIRSQLRNVAAVSPRITLPRMRAQLDGKSIDVLLEGIGEEGFRTASRRLIEGELFSGIDVRRATNVCVVSQSLAERLLAAGLRPDQPLHLNGVPFFVLGVVDDVTIGALDSLSIDLHVYAPYTSVLRRLERRPGIAISVQASDIEEVSPVRQLVEDTIEQRRKGRRSKFVTTSPSSLLMDYADGSRTVMRLLTAVGAVSLIVGGIGVMNIMLVSVTERTREIGLRMAVGTRHLSILLQFLTEAMLLGVLGGVIGVIFGWAASWLVAHINGWPISLTFLSTLTSLLYGVATVAFFGYQPAEYASQLNPVEALRAEG